MRLRRRSFVRGAAASLPLALAGFPSIVHGARTTVTVAMSQEPPTLGYALGSAYVASVVKITIGSEPGMVVRDDQNTLIPFLCETVPTVENGGAQFVGEGADRFLQVTFRLRPGVVWSDGTPLTSRDFKFGWELVMNPNYPVQQGRDLERKVWSVETPDDYTVIYNFMSENQAREAARNGHMGLSASEYTEFAEQQGPVLDPLYNRIGSPWAGAVAGAAPTHILSSMPVEEIDKSDYTRQPLGIGPFKVVNWVPGQYIQVDAVPTFFLGAPRLSSIIFKIIPNTNTILAQVQTGEVDVVSEDALQLDSAPVLDRLERDRRANVKAHYIPAMTWEHIDFNLDNEHLKDLRVRRAIAHAIDRQLIVDRVLYGKTEVIHSWIPPISWAYNPEIRKYPYDPNEAKRLLAEAGYTPGPDGILQKGGKKLTLKLQTTTAPVRQQYSQIIQQNLKAVGIDLQLEFLPAATFFASEGKGPLSNRTFELGVYAWVAGDDPGGVELYHSKNIPSKENAYTGQNYPGWRNPRNDELLTKAMSTLNQDERLPLYLEQQKLFAEELPVLPLFARPNISLARRTLQNFRPAPTNTPLTWNSYDWWMAE
jgi:peptide/nickel transport system substrate-binding protein